VESCNPQATQETASCLLSYNPKQPQNKWVVADFKSKYGGGEKKKYAWVLFKF